MGGRRKRLLLDARDSLGAAVCKYADGQNLQTTKKSVKMCQKNVKSIKKKTNHVDQKKRQVFFSKGPGVRVVASFALALVSPPLSKGGREMFRLRVGCAEPDRLTTGRGRGLDKLSSMCR